MHLFIDNAVDWLSGHMKGRYCSMRLNKYVEERDPWPPIKTKSYVTLALVYQKELQTTQETAAMIYLRTKGDIHKIPQTIDAKKLTDIAQIFDPVSGRVPNIILIEGHAGIGKTTLVKQVCIEWAEGKLLASDKLVLLLLLRDPNVQRITDEHKLIEHFTDYSTTELHKELVKNHGADITLIIDGFDELSTELRERSFFRRLVEKNFLPKAKILVTSRPSASACLHQLVDKRIEILGFEQSSKNQYVTEALQNSPSKLKMLQRHFQQYPNIDVICYVPLIMSIIVFLCKCQPDELPSTATEMYASFILHIICRYLKRVGEIREDDIIKEQFPPVVYKVLQQLEETAFDGLVNDKTVFTVEELPFLDKDDPTCYGLLQSTECYSILGTRSQSFNFLHLGIQEYFAAKYVTKLPDDKVYALLKESFLVETWGYYDVNKLGIRLSNMWILYCGMTKGQCKALRHYLLAYISPTGIFQYKSSYDHNTESISQHIMNNKVSILFLFQCFQEAQDIVMCKALSKSFDNGMIDARRNSLLPHHVVSLGYFLSKSHHRTWKQLNLSGCHIGDHGISILHQYLCRDKTDNQEITEINLSNNNLTGASLPLIVDIINHLQVHTLVFCNFYYKQGDLGTRALFKGLTNAKTLRVLHINNIRISEITAITNTMVNGSSLEELNLNNDDGKLAIRIIRSLHCNSTIVEFPNIIQFDDVVDISRYNLLPRQVESLGYFLSKSHHRTWKQLNLSMCHIGDHGLSILHQYLCGDKTDKQEITEINFSNNYLTGASLPLIADIICHLQVHTLLLCNNQGDLGAKVLFEGLTNAKTLRVLHINNISISEITAITNITVNSSSLEELNLNNDDGKLAIRIIRSLHHNNTITKVEFPNIVQPYNVIDISQCNLYPRQVESLGFFLSKCHHRKCKKLDLSMCHIGDHGLSILHQHLCRDKTDKQEITEINFSNNNLTGASLPLIADIISHLKVHTLVLCNNESDLGATVLTKGLTNTKTLRVLHTNKVGLSITAIIHAMVLVNNSSLEELNLNNDEKLAVRIIKSLHCNNTITKVELPNIVHSDDKIDISGHNLLPHQVESLGFFLSKSHCRKWKKVNLSGCHIGDHGVSILHHYLCRDKTDKQETTEINLSDNNLTGASSPLIADIINHLQVHTLVLCNNEITNVKDISTAAITSSTVKVLNLDDNGITAQEAVAISDMMICLEELHISNKIYNRKLNIGHYDNKLGNFGVEVLSKGITNTRTLRVLDIADNNIGLSGITAIVNALVSNTSLEELSLRNNKVGKDEAIVIANAITHNKTLKKLLLYNVHAIDEEESALIILVSLQLNNTITIVVFADISISFDCGVIDISAHSLVPHQVESLGLFLSKSRKWKEFNLSMCHIGDHGLRILHKYLCENRASEVEILEINLSWNNLTGVSSPIIADIIRHLQVQVLWLHNNDITTNLRDISAAVITSSTVKVLSLSDNYITAAQEVVAISDMMICLEELYISNNNRKFGELSKGIGDHGAKLLSRGIANTKTLRVLHIADNNIGSSGITAIANALLSNTSLEELNMNYNNEVEQDGAKAIAKVIINNKTLQKLLLYGGYMNDEAAMMIRRSLHHNNTITKLELPYCRVMK